MNNRPTSVTVISWLLIVLGVLSLAVTTLLRNNPMVLETMSHSPIPVSIQYVLTYLGTAITVISGIVMLKGKNLGRFLYVGWSVVSLLIALVTSPAKAAMIPGIVIFLVITFFLFRPKANAYFSESKSSMNA